MKTEEQKAMQKKCCCRMIIPLTLAVLVIAFALFLFRRKAKQEG